MLSEEDHILADENNVKIYHLMNRHRFNSIVQTFQIDIYIAISLVF